MPLNIVNKDITEMKVDAIVNTTNENLTGLGGVDFQIHQKAGEEFTVECQKLIPLGLGCAKITKGYNLPAKYVIHTHGPRWNGGLRGESIILKSCYEESLKLAVENKCKSVAFPLISSGTYGYPKDQVLRYASSVITDFLFEHEMTVYICIYDRFSYDIDPRLYRDIGEIVCGLSEKSFIMENEICSFGEESEERIRPIKNNCLMMCTGSLPTPKEKRADKEKKSLDKYIINATDKPFSQKLFDYIDRSGMGDVECYKRANIDRKTFSKIKCKGDSYIPKKQTAVAFAIALKLSLKETQDLLRSAGLTLSQSYKFDLIIMYFIEHKIYDIFVINEALFEFDQVCLGV